MPVGGAGRRSLLRLCPQIRDNGENDAQSRQPHSCTDKPIATPPRYRFHLAISPFRTCLANSMPAIFRIEVFSLIRPAFDNRAARDVSGHRSGHPYRAIIDISIGPPTARLVIGSALLSRPASRDQSENSTKLRVMVSILHSQRCQGETTNGSVESRSLLSPMPVCRSSSPYRPLPQRFRLCRAASSKKTCARSRMHIREIKPVI